jgi:hypothetical protein
MQPEIVYSWRKFPIESYSEEEKLGMMLGWLESEGFYLFFDEQTSEWELKWDEETENFTVRAELTEYSLIGKNKEEVISWGFNHLSH